MAPSEYFPNPQQDAETTIQILEECNAGIHPEGNGITDMRGSMRFLAKKILEDSPDEVQPETRQTLLTAAGLRITRRGKIRYDFRRRPGQQG